MRNMLKRRAGILLLAVMLFTMAYPMAAQADHADYATWADAADRIDQYLDTAFEAYLAGDSSNA